MCSRWWLRCGLLRGSPAGSGKGVSGTSSLAGGDSSSRTTNGILDLFALLWARVLKGNRFRGGGERAARQGEATKEKDASSAGNLLSILLLVVRAKRGIVENRLDPDTRRQGRGLPGPLGGGSGCPRPR